jgi:lipid A 3-O-deacylase
MNKAIVAAAVVCGLGRVPVAGAVDGLAVELAGSGADRVGFRARWDWPRHWFAEGDWYLGGHWEAGGSYWHEADGGSGPDSLFEVGAAAVLRLQRHRPLAGVTPFVEAGLGAHLMSETALGDRDFDIDFAFSEHVGAGVRFGGKGQWEIAYRLQHLSNAGLGDSNPGIDFHMLHVGYDF